VESSQRKGQVAALKAEPNDVEGGSAIKLEVRQPYNQRSWIRVFFKIAILRAMTEDGDKPHIPVVFHAAKHKKYCYMVMTLLGENLKSLKINCSKELMTPQTWSRLGVQCLYRYYLYLTSWKK
ncbi:unnamed protein product, partial [Cylicostephanus goldi]